MPPKKIPIRAKKLQSLESTLLIASDHAGFALKRFLSETLVPFLLTHPLASRHENIENWQITLRDLGPHNDQRVDYPLFAQGLCTELLTAPPEQSTLGILICGSGLGMSIAANRHDGIRAAHVESETTARLSREHNNANIICLGARVTAPETALELIAQWYFSEFQQGRHQARLNLIDLIDQRKSK